MILSYSETTKLLKSQGKFYINLGLERIIAILELMNNPQDNFKVIHIAGTNGKGSVASTLANILKCANKKTGLYTSPHLVEYTERIKINNIEISKQDFAKYVSNTIELADNNKIDLTEFEILTASAFKYFADNKVEYAILETGLGGRYDATNVVKNTLVSIITSISLDHTDRLGDTIDKIAYEKAGIIKQNSNVIASKANKGFNVISNITNEQNSKLHIVDYEIEMKYKNGTNYAIINNEEYEFPLLGLYQKENLALVIEATRFLNISKEALKEGLRTAFWGARLEYRRNKNILIDGAHNPDSARELKKSLDFYFKNENKIYIYSTINTKDYKKIAKILFDENSDIYYLEFNYPTAVSFENYKKDVPFLKNLKKLTNLDEVLHKDCLKIITGSFYMIGEIYNKKEML